MARVRNIGSDELPVDLAEIYEAFAGSYGPFRNQVAVFAHVPAALRHLMPLLMELREAKTLPKRATSSGTLPLANSMCTSLVLPKRSASPLRSPS